MPQLVKTYSDVNLSFTAHPLSGDLTPLTGADAVKRSVRNLVLTGFYERPMQPELGCGIQKLLFDPVTPFTTLQIQKVIQEVIGRFEPRAQMLNVLVKITPDENAYEASITFGILNQFEPITMQVILERTR